MTKEENTPLVSATVKTAAVVAIIGASIAAGFTSISGHTAQVEANTAQIAQVRDALKPLQDEVVRNGEKIDKLTRVFPETFQPIEQIKRVERLEANMANMEKAIIQIQADVREIKKYIMEENRGRGARQ